MKELYARVRYNRGKEGCGPDEGKAFDAESFVLETWDEDYMSWNVHSIAPLRRCVEHPFSDEKDFIHYTFMSSIIQLIRLGYRISPTIAE